MNIITASSLPRFWWLRPWTTARHLHRATTALNDLVIAHEHTIARKEHDLRKMSNLAVAWERLYKSRQEQAPKSVGEFKHTLHAAGSSYVEINEVLYHLRK